MKRVIIIGAGAAGLMAGVAASDAGADVTIYEHNEKAGKKIYITGKGRCNFTNACDTQDFFANVIRNPKFLYSAIYDYDQQHVIEFLENNGCPTKVERGNRAFPESDRASDVTKAFTDHLKRNHVRIFYNTEVKEILTEPYSDPEIDPKGKIQARAIGVRLGDGRKSFADAVILATGGCSYSSTGSTGDGYRFANNLGLEVKDRAPSLVPFELREKWPLDLQGLALKNISVKVYPASDMKKKKPTYEGFGEMLFTHFGISGPLIISASCHCDFNKHPDGYQLHLDLKPAIPQHELEARLKKEFEANPEKELLNAIRPLFPERLGQVVADLFTEYQQNPDSDCKPSAEGGANRKARTMNAKEISVLATLIKDVRMSICNTRSFNEAIVTKGGIAVKEINPSTMETKKIKNLFVAGEVIDVDAYTGGFNLQIAWSTGHLAGISSGNV